MHHPEMSRMLARELERERIAQARTVRSSAEGRTAGAARRALAVLGRPLRRGPAPALRAARGSRPA